MLVLTRRTNQSIVIGSDVIITIVEIRGEQVRLGIEAPRSVAVHRSEVLDQIREQNEQAATVGEDATALLPRPGKRRPAPADEPARDAEAAAPRRRR